MRNFARTAGAVALAQVVSADLCNVGSQMIGGNWYCQAVDTIQYSNFGTTGMYPQVTDMDDQSGTCSSTPYGFSGSLAPLNGEVSQHMRGPLEMVQFAFYEPGSKASKRSTHQHHAHHHHHAEHAEEKRDVGDWVTVTMDGKVVSWMNKYGGAPAAPTEAPVPHAGAEGGKVPSPAESVPTEAPSAPKGHKGGSSGQSAPFTPQYSGDWVRSAYYDAGSQTAQGLTFLNILGGGASGTFSYAFGNSLSYATSDGCQAASGPQTLAQTTIPSNQEVIIMSDKPCNGGSCGYVRPGTVAYHGFGGENKVFMYEFKMPNDGTSGWNMNMPALWMLNAQIPRTLQYGQADCSCWPKCGEFDLFEVLTSGDTRCKSTLHAGTMSGGDSDYFDRPTDKTIKAAVVMSNNMATIKVLPDDFDISTTLTNEQVEQLGNHATGGLSEKLGTSLFSLP